MKKLFLLLLLAACATTPAPKDFVAVAGGDTCLIDAISWQRALKADAAFGPETWTAILGIEWLSEKGAVPRGHAVCVYEFDGALWAYTSPFNLLPGGGSILLCRFEGGDPAIVKRNARQLAIYFMGDESLFARAWFIQRDPA